MYKCKVIETLRIPKGEKTIKNGGKKFQNGKHKLKKLKKRISKKGNKFQMV